MQRRDLLGAGIAAAMMSSPTVSGDSKCSTEAAKHPVVLVHGASHGGWCWRHVADELRNKGYRVFTPTLTGLGERQHLRSREISLETHIDDIVNVIRWEELNNVTLVAHSYGGTVITGVCDRLRDRITRVIFLDANTPGDGEPTIPGLTREVAEQVTGEPLADGYLVPALDPVRMGISPDDTANIEWLHRRLTGHPLQTLNEPIKLKNGGTDGMRRSYVLLTPLDQLQGFAKAGTLRIKADPSWNYYELFVGHDAMITAPCETAELLHQIITNTAETAA